MAWSKNCCELERASLAADGEALTIPVERALLGKWLAALCNAARVCASARCCSPTSPSPSCLARESNDQSVVHEQRYQQRLLYNYCQKQPMTLAGSTAWQVFSLLPSSSVAICRDSKITNCQTPAFAVSNLGQQSSNISFALCRPSC